MNTKEIKDFITQIFVCICIATTSQFTGLLIGINMAEADLKEDLRKLNDKIEMVNTNVLLKKCE